MHHRQQHRRGHRSHHRLPPACSGSYLYTSLEFFLIIRGWRIVTVCDIIVKELQKEVTKLIVNPILPGFNPDPCFCRRGGDYYIAVSRPVLRRLRRDELHERPLLRRGQLPDHRQGPARRTRGPAPFPSWNTTLPPGGWSVCRGASGRATRSAAASAADGGF